MVSQAQILRRGKYDSRPCRHYTVHFPQSISRAWLTDNSVPAPAGPGGTTPGVVRVYKKLRPCPGWPCGHHTGGGYLFVHTRWVHRAMALDQAAADHLIPFRGNPSRYSQVAVAVVRRRGGRASVVDHHLIRHTVDFESDSLQRRPDIQRLPIAEPENRPSIVFGIPSITVDVHRLWAWD